MFVTLKCIFLGIALRFLLILPDGRFLASHPRPTGRIHIVLNYIGPNDGEGTVIYYDGAEVTSDTTKIPQSYSPGDARIVVGRFYTNYYQNYGSFMVDELIYFNAALTTDDVSSIYNSA